MHFSKTYAQLLLTLPPELRDNAFQYRKLKQLINQTVSELDSLGLAPSVLRSLHMIRSERDGLERQDNTPALTVDFESVSDVSHRHATIAYEIAWNPTLPESRLRLTLICPSVVGTHHNHVHSPAQHIYHFNLLIPEQLLGHIMTALPPIMAEDEVPSDSTDPGHFPDLIIPLSSDTAFFQLLTSTLSSLSGHFDTWLDGFRSALTSLAASISSTARPASSSAPHTFSAYSPTTSHNAVPLCSHHQGESDLYTWREIFRLYAEVQLFETIEGSTHGERCIEDVEKQLKLFEQSVQDKKASMVFPPSRDALDIFLSLNVFILDVKKFQLANSEATRKILKKHAKRTTLPIPFHLQDVLTCTPFSRPFATIARRSKSLPRLLVQAIGEVLLPVVPHVDDYSCLICTYIAFKPIRLRCGHFFCVRCLVKLQRRGMTSCPLCRAPTILEASPSNIDYGLLNFMADWFPIESREKFRVNEQEVTREQLEDFGVVDIPGCRIM